MHKADDDVSDLDAGVVDVVLNFDAIAGGLQNAHERIAEHGIANVTDVRGFVWVDAGVLDHLLRSDRASSLHRRLRWTSKQAEQLRAIEEDIEITGAGDLDARDFVDVFQLRLEFFGDCAWRQFLAGGLFDEFREFERDREGEVAKLRRAAAFRRLSCCSSTPKSLARRGANLIFKLLLQVG